MNNSVHFIVRVVLFAILHITECNIALAHAFKTIYDPVYTLGSYENQVKPQIKIWSNLHQLLLRTLYSSSDLHQALFCFDDPK